MNGELAAHGERTPRRLALAFQNERARLDAARARVRAHLEAHAVDERARYAVDLALEELGSNALVHGYAQGARGELSIELEIAFDHVHLAFVDDAPAFDPTRHPEPAPTSSLRDAPPRGRGISMVRASVRSWSYRRDAQRNRVELDIARAAR